jgi:hypothetical protein
MANNLKALQEKLRAKAAEAASQKNENEFVPETGKKVTVRILPPINEDDLFYWVHSYHYLPNVKKYLYTHKEYIVDGTRLKDPIDVAVGEWYDSVKATKDKETTSIAGTMKRKKHYFFQVLLVDEPDPEKKFKILVDRSNDGKLARIICDKMGLPFFIDPSSNWVDKNTLEIDEDKKYFDLLDFEKGHDFKIVKTQIGKETWDIDYTKSFVIETPRALTAEERELLKKRVDLKTYIKAEESYDVVKGHLENFLVSLDPSATVEDVQAEVAEEDEEVATPKKAEAPKVKKAASKPVAQASDEDIDEMLKELDKDGDE